MPNWMYNEIVFDTVEDLQKTLDFMKINEQEFDFNTIIPIPNDVEDTLNWCIDNWGTKWNACDFEKINESTIHFMTANTVPVPVLQAIYEKLGVHFATSWIDEYLSACGGHIADEDGFSEVYSDIEKDIRTTAAAFGIKIYG